MPAHGTRHFGEIGQQTQFFTRGHIVRELYANKQCRLCVWSLSCPSWSVVPLANRVCHCDKPRHGWHNRIAILFQVVEIMLDACWYATCNWVADK